MKGPAKTFTPVSTFDIHLNPAGQVTFSFPARENALLLVMQGKVEINGQTAKALDLVLFENDGEEVIVRARKDARSLLLSGASIDEPVIRYGPFVMNTEQEIRRAIEDFNHGEFGELAD